MRAILLLIGILLFANVKTELKQTKHNVYIMNKKLDSLANKIQKTKATLNEINNQIKSLNQQIKKLSQELTVSNDVLKKLIQTKETLTKQKEKINQEIIKFLSQNYYIDNQEIATPEDLINSEIIKAALKKASKDIEEKIKNETKLNQEITIINQQINSIIQKQNQLKKAKQELNRLKDKQIKTIKLLTAQKQEYKQKLQHLINKQKELQKKLAELKIIKKEPKLNVSNVRKVGNVYFRVKTANYRGPKTIPPVRGRIVKKFGSYIDPIYKIRIYNDTITIKPYQKNAIIRSIFSGKVVYIDKNKGIIAIKHRNNLFSIYANLTKISPILKKGSYVKKGQIIARSDLLELEVTYKDRPINPLKVIKF